MIIQLALKPISVNQCWQGRKFKTKKYKDWREEMGWAVKAHKKQKPILWCEVEINFYIIHYATSDVDNMIKPLLDALVETGVLKDDKYIKSVKATKHKSKKEGIQVEIREIMTYD